jgi:serine/threonine-protein kinase RsbW
MRLIEGSHCVAGEGPAVQLALREALDNAVVHGNGMDARKLVHIRCRCDFGRGLSLIVSDQGKGFEPESVPNPLAIENIEAEHGRGLRLIKAVMDKVSFGHGGTEVRMRRLTRKPGTELRRSSQGY